MSSKKETIMAIYLPNYNGYFRKSRSNNISKTAAAADHYTIQYGIENRIDDLNHFDKNYRKVPLGPFEIHTFDLIQTKANKYVPKDV